MDGKIKRLHYGDVMIELPYEIECDKKVFKLYSMEQQMIAMLWYAIKNIMEEIVKIKENKDDSISRQEVLRAIITAEEVEPDLGYTHLHKVIENLPSAEPLTEEDYIELRDRFGEFVEYVVRDMITGKGERWK